MKNQSRVRAAKDLAKQPYAWPGGYPKFAVMTDGECMCHRCVKKEFGLVGRATHDGLKDGWAVDSVEINWEDSDLRCCHCDARIESAYAEDQVTA